MAILHPRGEEYQTQYVMDGIPLTDNRSAAFVADFDADEVQEMSVMTAGFPAEYGKKTRRRDRGRNGKDTRLGFHGKIVGVREAASTLRADMPKASMLAA